MTSVDKKNNFLELMRFIFCMVIFLHHSGFVAGGKSYIFQNAGYYAVEFFFILTGAFAYKSTRKYVYSHIDSEGSSIKDSAMKYSMKYTISKLKRIFPYALVGIILAYIWDFLYCSNILSLKDNFIRKWNIVLELTFIPMTGIMKAGLENYLNAPLWYLSVLLICLPVMVFIIIKYRDVYDNYLCIIGPFLLYGYLLHRYETIGTWGAYTGILYNGVIRGFADLLLGSFVFILSEKIDWSQKNGYRLLSTIIEIAGYVFAIYVFNSNLDGYASLFAILFMAFSVSITLSEQSYSYKLNTAALGHLGELSLPIYCFHWPVYRLVTYFIPNINYYTGVAVVFVICLVMAEAGLFIMKKNSKRPCR